MREFISNEDICIRLGIGYFGGLNEGNTQMFLMEKAEDVGLKIISFCVDGIIVIPIDINC